jgi:Methyltransferase domain
LVASLGIDLFGRSGMIFDFCDLDTQFPVYVLQQTDRFKDFICNARFNEKWISPEALMRLFELCRLVEPLQGALVEIGAWEGRSTTVLAHACYPEKLLAVDTWLGNADEDPNHSSVIAASKRDVYQRFLCNVAATTCGNVVPLREDCHSFLERCKSNIKFAFVDASHDYTSVNRTINALLPLVTPGGVLCGDDFRTASQDRKDLSGGVERAVRELLPGFEEASNLWWWRR